MLKIKYTLLTTFIFVSLISFAQRGKDGAFTTVSLGTVVNRYTAVTSNASAGGTSIVVASASLTGYPFSGALSAGDLIMIIQMQGADLNIDWFNGQYGSSTGIPGYPNPNPVGELFGPVLYLNNTGNFEIREVLSVSGNTITLTCGLERSYTALRHVQVVRIPRFTDLKVANNTSITPLLAGWNGTTGGIVAIEVSGNLTLTGNGLIDATGKGFRGGLTDGTSLPGSTTPHSDGPGNGSTYLGITNNSEGGRKGEGIGGSHAEYNTGNIYSSYGRGAMANGGGGGGYQNAGGGGGANIGTGIRTGKGIPDAGYAAIWNLERPGMGSMVSPGGGRGGYSLAQSDQDETVQGPNKSVWGGDARKENGGYGGHAIDYDGGRLFFGGGGGAGGQDSGQGGKGGNGGGIVHLTVYGNISGSGMIRSNGDFGENSNPLNVSAGLGQVRGNDGAGGAGGGGYIYVKSMSALPSTITLQANGGKGGDQDLRVGFGGSTEVAGPGAGGAGGGIAFTSGTPTTTVSGGAAGTALKNGTVNNWVSNFPSNGATGGGSGITNLAAAIFNIIPVPATICGSQTASLSASVTGTQPAGSSLQWFSVPFGGTALATGNTFTTPVLNANTTYYVGLCPGTFRVPVTVTVGQNPIIAGTPVITNATCNTQGSITGLTVSGGVAPLTYTWNGATSVDQNLASAPSGSYTLRVTDANGCFSQSGPHTILGVGGPTISGTINITDVTCLANGSITGLVASGTATPLTFDWNGTSSATTSLANATAGSYTLVVTDANNCTATSGPHTISTIAGPTVLGTVAIINATCTANGSISGLSANGGVAPFTYVWNGTNSATADLASGIAGNYTLVITDANGCTVNSGPHTIGTTAGPTMSGTAIVTDVPCVGNGSITGLSTTGGVTPYTYSWNGVSSSNANLSTGTAGNYTLVITDNNGCTVNSGPHTIGNTPPPTIGGTAVITNATCTTGGSITGLNVSGGSNPYFYSWNSVISPTQNLSGAAAGSYTLVVLDGNGCTAQSGPYTISQTGGPVLNTTNVVLNNEACSNGNGSISAITISGGATPYQYQWNGVTVADLNPTGLSAASYSLVVTDANGCTVNAGPFVITNTPPPAINSTSSSIVDATCSGSLGSINNIVATGNNLAYSWSNSGGTVLNPSNLTAGSYTLTVTDQVTNCSATAGPFVVGSTPAPVISEVNAVVVSENCNGALGSISGVTATGTGVLSYAWTNTAQVTSSLTGLSSGTYQLTVTDAATNCSVTSSVFSVGYIAGPDADFIYSPLTPALNDQITFTDQSTGSVVGWNWSVDTNVYNIQNPDYLAVTEGIISATLTVIDANGCFDSMTVPIEISSNVSVPNILTMNGDGVNDVFEIKGLSPNTSLFILNRWGEEVFVSDNYLNNWKGQDKSGLPLVDGVYFYRLKLPNNKWMEGFVHLKGN